MTGKRMMAVGRCCSVGTVIVSEADVTPSGTIAWAGFITGYNAAIRGADLAEMQTADEREGWWHARKPRYK